MQRPVRHLQRRARPDEVHELLVAEGAQARRGPVRELLEAGVCGKARFRHGVRDQRHALRAAVGVRQNGVRGSGNMLQRAGLVAVEGGGSPGKVGRRLHTQQAHSPTRTCTASMHANRL